MYAKSFYWPYGPISRAKLVLGAIISITALTIYELVLILYEGIESDGCGECAGTPPPGIGEIFMQRLGVMALHGVIGLVVIYLFCNILVKRRRMYALPLWPVALIPLSYSLAFISWHANITYADAICARICSNIPRNSALESFLDIGILILSPLFLSIAAALLASTLIKSPNPDQPQPAG